MNITRFNPRKKKINADFVALIMWLLVFVVFLVLSLQPVFASKSKISQAGWTSTDMTFYSKAPMTVISGSTSGNSIVSGTTPLFTTTGVNTSVIIDSNSTKIVGYFDKSIKRCKFIYISVLASGIPFNKCNRRCAYIVYGRPIYNSTI